MSLSSLRFRLAALVGLCLLPALAILVWFGARHREALADVVRSEATRTAMLAGELHARSLAETDGLLDGLSRLPAVIDGPGDACQAVLRGLVGDRYVNLGVAGMDGRVWCSALPLSSVVNVADRSWFRDAFTTAGFVLGGYQVGRLTGAPVLTVARPVSNHSGPVGVVFAGIDLHSLASVADTASLPTGSFLVVTDRAGTVLARRPPVAAWTGTSFPERLQAPDLLGMGEGVRDAVRVDGADYLLAHGPLGPAGSVDAHVFVAIPRREAFAPVDEMLDRVYTGLFAVSVAVIGLVWIGSDLLVVRRALALLSTAERLGAGDLSARAGLPPGRDEFGRLAAAFDQMAANIERVTALHRQTIEAAGEGIVTLTPNGRISSANPAAARILGLRADQVVGANAHALLHGYEGGGHEAADCPLRIPARDGVEQRNEDDSFQRAGGPRFPVSWVAGPLRDGEKIVGVALVFADQGQRRRLEEELRQAAKMEVVGQLAGGVAHDFNNLLTAILGYSDLLKAHLDPTGRAWRDADEIVRAANRASALTQQLLSFSRRREMRVRVLELNPLVANLEKLLRRLIGEHIELDVRLSPEVTTVRADSGQLEQVFVNLAVNGRDAMPQGGQLVIETTAEAPPGASGSWACVSVSDTGDGMAPELLERIFEPFFTTKHSGTGLGLSVVQRIVHACGGQISCSSTPGEGTSFRVFLPQLVDEADISWPRGAERLVTGTETILLVEDEESVRTLVRRALEPLGYTIVDAESGRHAMGLARVHDGPIHLLLTDVVMPGMNGSELYAALTPSRPALRVLFMSGYDGAAGGPIPAVDGPWLPKPFTAAQLAERVRAVLDEGAAAGSRDLSHRPASS